MNATRSHEKYGWNKPMDGRKQYGLSRRIFFQLATATAGLPLMARLASAEVYPSRPVHMIVDIPAGLARRMCWRGSSGRRFHSGSARTRRRRGQAGRRAPTWAPKVRHTSGAGRLHTPGD